jgi:hypothetical protein
MAAQAYTDLFNTAINTLATKLNTVTGLVCVTDPRYVYEQLETTSFGDTARKFGGDAVTSLQNNSIEVTLYQSYAASETEATIYGLVGIQTTIIVAPATGSVSATNPFYTLLAHT